MQSSRLVAVIILISFIFNFLWLGPLPTVQAQEDEPPVMPAPRIETVYPNFGDEDTVVTIRGRNFGTKDAEGFELWMGSKLIEETKTHTDNQISFQVPADAVVDGQAVDITIITSHNTEVTLKNAFAFVNEKQKPKVTGISPNTGTLHGGTKVTIEGEFFLQAAPSALPKVMFGELEATGVKVISTTKIEAVTPASTMDEPNSVEVQVINPGGGKSDDKIEFEYISEGEQMRLINITPNEGPIGSEIPVTIQGVNFPINWDEDKKTVEPLYNWIKLRVGDVSVTEYVYEGVEPEKIKIVPYGYYENEDSFVHHEDRNGNKIFILQAVIPSFNETGYYDVEVSYEWSTGPREGKTGADTLINGFRFYYAETYPMIDTIVNDYTGESRGPIGGGHPITIKGSGFRSGAEVYFGDVKVEKKDGEPETGIISITETEIKLWLPAGKEVGPVDVIVRNMEKGEVTGQAVKHGGFTYAGTSMVLYSITPNSLFTDQINVILTIKGENLDEDKKGKTIVSFEHRVLNPEIRNPNPNNPDHYIRKWKDTLQDVKIVDGQTITGRIPSGNIPAAVVDLVVETFYGEVRLPNAFTFKPPQIIPKITSVWAAVYDDEGNRISPRGPVEGGTKFIIEGENFYSDSNVYMGDNHDVPLRIEVPDTKTIHAWSPPGEPGWHSITVQSSTGHMDTLPANPDEEEGKKGFYYYTNPKITDVSPNRGSIHGGNIITITGEQFYPGLTVNFGFETEDGTFISVTEEVYGENQIRLVDNNTIQLRLPKLVKEILEEHFDDKYKQLEKDGELAVQVQVVNKDERSAVWSRTFLYKEPKDKIEIRDVTPAIGRVEGGPQIVIRGDNFHPDATVHFGWEKAEIISLSKTEIIVTAPPNPVGKYVITVSNHFDTGTATWDPFEYLDPSSYPKIEGVFPPMGPVAGGTKITITGIGFWPGAEIWIGGKRAEKVEANYTYATAITPEADNVGPADVMIVNPDGGTDLLPGGFTYRLPDSEPEIYSISPKVIPTTGGTVVTIEGKDFRKGVTVYFGTEAAEIVHFIEPNEIVVKAPPYLLPIDEEAFIDVTVQNRDGGVAQEENAIKYVLPRSEPIIDGITPDRGPAAGGTLVIIEGDGFSSRGVTVYFGGNEAVVQSIRYDRLEVITPPGEPGEPVHVTVTNHDPEVLGSYTLEKAYTYEASKPEIFTVAPNQGSYEGGTEVTITGRDFTSVVKAVYIGKWEAEDVVVLDSETITFTTPRIADSPDELEELIWWDVKVINADGVEAVKKEAFRFLVPDSDPVIDFIEPNKGPTVGGLPVTIYGTDFRYRAKVVIGGKDAEVLMIDDTPGEGNAKIIVKIPPHTPGEKDVVVINYEGAKSNTVKFEYIAPKSFPEIHSVEPPQGPTLGDTEVIITGIGFKVDEETEAPPRVWFGMHEAPEVEFIDYKTLRVITPPGEEGNVDVLVLNPDMGQAILENAFRYIKVKELVIDKVEPNEGTAEGGTEITITGGPFDQGAVVTIGGNPALEVVVVDSNTITAVTPPGEIGWQEVRVKNPDGGWAALPAGFFYIKPRTAPEHPPGWVDTERKDRETIEVRWEPVEFANYYEIWVSNTRNGKYRFLAQTDRTVYYATGLDYNTNYYFQIRAVNELGVSDFSYYESARTGSGRQQETNLLPENIIMETANGNVTATVATANALAYTGYRIDFTQAAYQNANRKAVRISQKALSQSYLPITIEAPGLSLSVPSSSIYLGLLAAEEDYAEIIITDLGQQVAERAMRELPRGSRIISPVYEIGWQIIRGTKGTPQSTFHQQVQLTMQYNVSITPGKQVSLYTYNPTTGRWINTGAANDPSAPQLTLGITDTGRFMLVEH